MNTQYTKEYFIAKFEAIPDELWTTRTLLNKAGERCAMGHCGATIGPVFTEESAALDKLLKGDAILINDGERWGYKQPTPRDRILAALRDLP